MSTKKSKEDAKNPDVVTTELRKGFAWSASHLNLLIGFGIAFILLGAGITFLKFTKDKKETSIQEQYYSFEKQYLEKKQKFEQSETQIESLKNTAAGSTKTEAKADAKNKNAKNKKQAEPPAPENIATGDLTKDYGAILTGLKDIIAAAPSSKGAKMAALNISEIQAKYKNIDQALESLNKVDSQDKDLLSAMIKVQLGTILADKQDCAAAIKSWDQVLANKSAEFIHSAVKLKKGLCYEVLNDTKLAGELYAQVKEESKGEGKDSALGKSAEKYLRLLKSKTN